MKPGKPTRLSEKLNAELDVSVQQHADLMRTHLERFRADLSASATNALSTIKNDLDQLTSMTGAIQTRTANQIRERAISIQQAVEELEASRLEWRSVTWKTMAIPYAIGVILTFWIVMAAVNLTFPEPPQTPNPLNLQSFGLEGTMITTGPSRLGRVVSLPPSVELADCPLLTPNGGTICLSTPMTR